MPDIRLRLSSRGDVVLQLGSDSDWPGGLFETLAPVSRRVQLQPGDRFVIYSDGLTEAMDDANVEFGAARVQPSCFSRAVAAFRVRTFATPFLARNFEPHTNGCPQSDDVTVITGVVR